MSRFDSTLLPLLHPAPQVCQELPGEFRVTCLLGPFGLRGWSSLT